MKSKRLFLPVILTCLAVYLMSVPHHPSLDPDLPLINSAAGRADLPPGAHPLWSTLIFLLDAITPAGQLARVVRLLSVLGTALAASILAEAVSRLPRNRLLAEAHLVNRAGERGLQEAWVRYLSGWAAGCLFAFCPAFFAAAATVGPAAFHLLLVFAIVSLVARARGAKRPVPALTGASFLTGLAVAEYAALIPWAPVLAVIGLAGLTRRGKLDIRSAVLPAIAALAGLALGYGILLLFWLGPIREGLIPGRTLLSVVIDSWRTQAAALLALTNPMGLSITIACSLVPSLYLLVSAKNQEPGPTGRVLGGVLGWIMAGLGIAVLLETPLSPNVAYAGWARLIVPYVLVCVMLGYLSGVVLAAAWTFFPKARGVVRYAIRGPVAAALVALPLAAAVLGWSSLRPFRDTDAPRVAAAAVRRIAAGDMVLLRNDPLDPLIVYYIGGRRDGPTLVNLARPGLPDRQRIFRGLFPELRDYPGRIDPEVLAAAACRRAPGGVVTWAASLLVQVGTPWTWDGMLFRAASGKPVPDPAPTDAAEVELWSALGRQSIAVSSAPFDIWYTVALQCSRLLNDAGVVLDRAGRPDEAKRLYERAAEACPDNMSAKMNLAQRAAGDGAFERGIEIVESARAVLRQGLARPDPAWIRMHHGLIHAPEAYAQLGVFLAARGKADPAISELEQALAMSPQAPRLRTLLARLHIQQGEYGEAETMLRQILEEDPESVDAREALAILRAHQGDLAAASQLLEQTAGAGGSPEVRATIALLRAQTGDLLAAEAALAGIADAQRPAAMVTLARAYVAARRGDAYEARALLDEARPVLGDRPDLLLLSAEIHKILGQEEETERAVRAALDLDPSNPSGLAQMILLLMARGDVDQAVLYARRRLENAPDDWLALLVEGTWELQQGRFTAAADPLRRSVESRPTALGLNNLAWALDQAGQTEEALEQAQRALALAPDYADLLDTLGWLLYRTGAREEGLGHLQRVLQLEPKSPSAHMHLGLIAEFEGREGAARGHLEIAADGGLDGDAVAAARRQLADAVRH